MARAMDSSKVDAMGREAKQDAKLGYKTIPFCITFTTLEDKNAFKDSARALDLNCKESFPKQYNEQKERAQDIYKKSIFNHHGTWTKADVHLLRPEDPLYITIQTKKANSTDRWETKARVKMLPSATWGRIVCLP